MSYKVELAKEARATLTQMPQQVQEFVVGSLRRLESKPQGESRPTSGLYAKGFIFELEYALGNLDLFIDILFRYEPEPDCVHIFQILWEYK